MREVICKSCETKQKHNQEYCRKCGSLFIENKDILNKYDNFPSSTLNTLLRTGGVPRDEITLVNKVLFSRGIIKDKIGDSDIKKEPFYILKSIIFYLIISITIGFLLPLMEQHDFYTFFPFLILIYLKFTSVKESSINQYLAFSLIFFPLIIYLYIEASRPYVTVWAAGIPFYAVISLEYIILVPFLLGRIYSFFEKNSD